MDTALIIALIVVGVAVLSVSIIILILLFRSRNVEKTSLGGPDEVGRVQSDLQSVHSDVQILSNNLAGLKESLPLLIAKENGQNMLTLQKSFAEQAEKDNTRLSVFQSSLATSINQRLDAMNKALVDSTAAMNQKISDNFLAINERVNESLQNGFKSTAETMGSLRESLGKMNEAQANLEKLQKDVVSLNNVLSSNQSRGQYGEMQLSLILEATWPNGKGTFYEEQYVIAKAKDGEDIRPDAVVFFPRQKTFICIDSKFPLTHYANLYGGNELSEEEKTTEAELFKRDVKAKFAEVASKYILAGITMKQAILFIPNDGIFAYIHSELKEVVEEGLRQSVILASPSVLQPILVTFHAAQIDAERAANLDVLNTELASLGNDFRIFGEKWRKLHDNIDHLQNSSSDVDKTIKRMDNKFGAIAGAKPENSLTEEPKAIADEDPD